MEKIKLYVSAATVLFLVITFTPANAGEPVQGPSQLPAGATWVVSNGYAMDFVYSRDEMLNFDIEQYLATHARHLLPHAETISHFAGKDRISPRLIMAIIEQQSGIIGTRSLAHQKPFGWLSPETGFIEQTRDFTRRLARARYSNAKSGTQKLSTQTALQTVLPEEDIPGLGSVYRNLFPDVTSPMKISPPSAAGTRVDPGIQFPWAIGTSWEFGGAHADNGSNDYPLNCFDFATWEEDWGDPIPDDVVASHSGIVVDHSSCYLEILLDETWSTSYYHMDNLKFETDDSVTINESIGNYAGSRNQALCNGGSSTGPHVHWCLWEDNQAYHLDDVVISGWTTWAGTDSYDDNCNRNYMERDGETICPWRQLENEGIPGTVVVGCMDSGYVEFDTLATVHDETMCQTVEVFLPEINPGLNYNPFNREMSVDLKGTHLFNLYDMGGRVLLTHSGNQGALYKMRDLNLKAGMYVIQISAEGKIYRQKLVIL